MSKITLISGNSNISLVVEQRLESKAVLLAILLGLKLNFYF